MICCARCLVLALGFAANLLAILVPTAIPMPFAALILSEAVFAYWVCPGRAILASASFALLLIGRLLTNPLLSTSPAFAWHALHLVMVLWLLLFAAFSLASQRRCPACLNGSISV